MSGPVPKETRRRRNVPVRGDWQATPGVGWQHGPIPAVPDGLMPPSIVAWETWMRAWFASHWSPSDLPGLRTVIRLYDQVERNEFHRSAELRMAMDNYGITPKGQQDRRWAAPKDDETPVSAAPATAAKYGHLRSVG